MEFIGSQARADEILEKAFTSPLTRAFYLDIEADNFHHYQEILCTVQMFVNGKFYLLDAITLDLSGWFTKILEEQVIWLHGCDYDLYLLNRYLGKSPKKLFDTQLAARLCGFRKFGYAPLVEQICGVKLPKDSQRADWTKRPLPPKMIKYAENDVRYLPQISDVLLDKLDKKKRMKWFLESCSDLTSEKKQQVEALDPWRISGAGQLKSSELRFLKTLYSWRDDQAREIDKPTFKVMNNQQLLTLSKSLADGEDVLPIKGFSAARKASFEKVVEEASALNEERWPKRLPKKPYTKVKIDEDKLNELTSKRDKVAEQLNIEGSFIASRKFLEAIVKDPENVKDLLNWQRELLQL